MNKKQRWKTYMSFDLWHIIADTDAETLKEKHFE